MSRRNPHSSIAPQVVLEFGRAVEAKIGRPSYIRQVKNRKEWFISDPVFSFVQHGLRKGATGYRVGYFYSHKEDLLAFYLVHSPIMAQLFKKNLSVQSLIYAATTTSSFRSKSLLGWSSRAAKSDGGNIAGIEEMEIDSFVARLKEFDNAVGFVNDLFPTLKNQKTGIGPATWAGNDFFLLLAENASALSAGDIASIVQSTWPLFLCLYPIDAIEQRVASLARNLKAAKLPKVCEYDQIKDIPDEKEISSWCRGEIEGSHIKPHSLGGSDRLENGLWLCQYHHRATEGRLVGSRSSKTLNVRFISK